MAAFWIYRRRMVVGVGIEPIDQPFSACHLFMLSYHFMFLQQRTPKTLLRTLLTPSPHKEASLYQQITQFATCVLTKRTRNPTRLLRRASASEIQSTFMWSVFESGTRLRPITRSASSLLWMPLVLCARALSSRISSSRMGVTLSFSSHLSSPRTFRS